MPPAKRPKINPVINRTLDIYGSSNYLPELSEEERERAQAQLAIPHETRDVETFFDATKILLRHEVENKRSVEWLCNNFTYLLEVSASHQSHYIEVAQGGVSSRTIQN